LKATNVPSINLWMAGEIPHDGNLCEKPLTWREESKKSFVRDNVIECKGRPHVPTRRAPADRRDYFTALIEKISPFPSPPLHGYAPC
jgi:hypothetical protein